VEKMQNMSVCTDPPVEKLMTNTDVTVSGAKLRVKNKRENFVNQLERAFVLRAFQTRITSVMLFVRMVEHAKKL
jgi:hypothetical protein